MEKHDAFDQLGTEDQSAAIDVAVALIVLGIRIPSVGKPIYDYAATEFTSCRGLPANVVKYALRSLGKSLATESWILTIQKDGENLITKFTPEKKEGLNSVEDL